MRNVDAEGTIRMTGKALMDEGVAIELKEKPGAAVVMYAEGEVADDFFARRGAKAQRVGMMEMVGEDYKRRVCLGKRN